MERTPGTEGGQAGKEGEVEAEMQEGARSQDAFQAILRSLDFILTVTRIIEKCKGSGINNLYFQKIPLAMM